MADSLYGSDPHQWVYHYTRLETALEYILPSMELRLSPLGSVNDPRESKEWYFSASYPDGETLDAEEFMRWQGIASNAIKGGCKVLCTTQDDGRIALDTLEDAFHRGFARPRMWAQYAEGHRGVCLALSRQSLDATISTTLSDKGVIHCGPVRYLNMDHSDYEAFHLDYREILDSSLDAVLERKLHDHWSSYFFVKAEDWGSEIEWRWVLCGREAGPEYVSIKDSLRAIIIGADCPKCYEPALVPFGEALRIPVMRMYWQNGRPLLLPEPFHPDA